MPKTSNSRSVYVNLKVIREAKGYNQAELGRLLGVSRQQMSAVENGYIPNTSFALNLAVALNVPVDMLFMADIEKLPPNSLLKPFYEKYSAIAYIHTETGRKVSYQEMVQLVKENPYEVLKYKPIYLK